MESKATERSPPGSRGYESCQSWGRKSQLTALRPSPCSCSECLPLPSLNLGTWTLTAEEVLPQGSVDTLPPTHVEQCQGQQRSQSIAPTCQWAAIVELSTVLGTGGWLMPSISSQSEISTPPALTWTGTHQNYSYSLEYPVRPEVGFSRGWIINHWQDIVSIICRASLCSLSHLVLRLIL